VIIPALNSAIQIPKILTTVHNQDYRPIEVILVDGGSTDGTMEITLNLQRQLGVDYFDITVTRVFTQLLLESDPGDL
jgi:glycosyltransferase involved in cell wall biosynthesis